jgi:putative hemolysin
VLAQVGLVLGFIVLGGFFAAAEMALVSLRPGQVSRLEQEGRRGRTVARLVGDPNRFLSAVQIGVTLAGFFSASVGAVTLSVPVAEALERAGMGAGPARTLALVLVTMVVAYLSLVLGELAPKRIALQRSEAVARLAAAPLDALARATRPVIWLLGRSSDLVVRLFGGNPAADRDVMTEEELRDIVARNEDLTLDERHLIADVLDAGDRPIREVMVPRLDVAALQVGMTVTEAVQATADRPWSRYPVVDGGLDDVTGFVHLRDVLTATDREGTVGALARPVLRLPDSRRALPALAQMRREGAHLAVVVDEYGGSAGIVTLEDLIEELVGDITDEYDRDADPTTGSNGGPGRGPTGRPRPPRLPVEGVDAQLRLDEFADATGVDLPVGPYDTAAGWVVSRLGRIPRAGDGATHEDPRLGEVRLVVTRMGGRRVEEIRVERVEPTEQEPAEQGPAAVETVGTDG